MTIADLKQALDDASGEDDNMQVEVDFNEDSSDVILGVDVDAATRTVRIQLK